jgi:hypothetical protein
MVFLCLYSQTMMKNNQFYLIFMIFFLQKEQFYEKLKNVVMRVINNVFSGITV